jgi:hypothetical protein
VTKQFQVTLKKETSKVDFLANQHLLTSTGVKQNFARLPFKLIIVNVNLFHDSNLNLNKTYYLNLDRTVSNKNQVYLTVKGILSLFYFLVLD